MIHDSASIPNAEKFNIYFEKTVYYLEMQYHIFENKH